MGELIGVWWNGRWRVARRDVRLERKPEQWVVTAREGGSDGKSRPWEFGSEAEARALVNRCIATGGDGWHEITRAYQAQQQMRDDRAKPDPRDRPG